jgi:hypothetical protein
MQPGLVQVVGSGGVFSLKALEQPPVRSYGIRAGPFIASR